MKVIFIDRCVKEPNVFRKVFADKSETYLITTDLNHCSSEEIDIVVIWLEVPAILRSFPNLELILVCGSGIDHIIDNNNLPEGVPLVRLVDFDLRQRVANYVLDHVKEYQNKLNNSDYENPSAGDRLNRQIANSPHLKIGIMGLGLIGSTIARTLESYGIEVFGWVRTKKKRAIKNVFIGRSSLSRFAEQCEIIICQLPLTPATKGILNRELFYSMPKAGYIINVGRGAHLNDDDLIEAIETGQLLGASLDVFAKEPLPEDHPFYEIQDIRLTPHIAGIVDPQKQANYAYNVIQDFYKRKRVDGMVVYKEKY